MENVNIADQKTLAVLVGIVTHEDSQEEVEISLDELTRLLDTAGGEVYARVIQNKETPDARTVIGSGKVKEIADLCAGGNVTLIVFDSELSPSQIRNLEDGIGHDVRVIDRSMLILDIFALHAVTGEGKLQVELAQLRYTAPRLAGHGADMSRLGGGIGTRGPGESKLESDKRHMQRRIHALEEELKVLEQNRRTMRAARDRSGLCRIAIVGYTNAGKSTLLNYLTDAGILAQDKLFATLDPTTRQLELPCGEVVLLTDTVGFIRKLPHHLIEAFKSTLEEASLADILLLLIDASDPEWQRELAVTEQLLQELGAGGKPILYVFNKSDICTPEIQQAGIVMDHEKRFLISARTGKGVSELLQQIEDMIHEGHHRITFVFPNNKAGLVNQLYKNATVESVDYGADGVHAVAMVDEKTLGQLREYAVDAPALRSDEDE